MAQGIPGIKKLMTSFPFWIGIDATILQARQLMDEKAIHHLPIKDKGELVGVITRKDLEKFLHYQSDVAQGKSTSVAEVIIKEPYIVDIDEPLDNVLLHMANNHLGSVVVTSNGRLAGVFTTNDACRCFGEYLQEQFRPPEGTDAA